MLACTFNLCRYAAALRDRCRLLEAEARFEREERRNAEDAAAAAELGRVDVDQMRDQLER